MENLFGVVDKTNDQKNIDSEKDVLVSTVETIKNNLRSCEIMFAVGFESRPSKNDKLIIIPFGNSKRNLVAIAGKNETLTPLLNDGERRISSTNKAGNQIQVKFFLRNDGVLEIDTEDNFEVVSKVDAKIDADNNIVFHSGSDFAVRFSAIEALINQIESNFNFFINTIYNLHTHAGVGIPNYPDPTSGPISLDPAPMKIDNIKVP